MLINRKFVDPSPRTPVGISTQVNPQDDYVTNSHGLTVSYVAIVIAVGKIRTKGQSLDNRVPERSKEFITKTISRIILTKVQLAKHLAKKLYPIQIASVVIMKYSAQIKSLLIIFGQAIKVLHYYNYNPKLYKCHPSQFHNTLQSSVI